MFTSMLMGNSPKVYDSKPYVGSVQEAPYQRIEHDAPEPPPRPSLALVDSLDLSMVKMKLCLPLEKEGKRWTQAEAGAAEVQYKRFLKLCVLYPNEDIVPSHQIDAIWHQHILDTRAYDADCQRIFGFKLHHYPYFGLRDEQDAQDLADAFERTCELFVHHFGVSPVGLFCGCNGQGGNGSGGGGGKCSRKRV